MILGKPVNPTRQRIGVRILGSFGLFIAVSFWCLYLMNLRSRILYHGPDWSYLGWIAAYFTVTGIGLLMLKKWAVLLSFLPAIAFLVRSAINLYKDGFSVQSDFITAACCAGVMIIVPLILLRNWRLLKW